MHLCGVQKPWAPTSRRQPPPGKVTVAGNLQSARGRISSDSKRIFIISSADVPTFMFVAATSPRELAKAARNGNVLVLLFNLIDLDRIVYSQCSNLKLATEISTKIHGRCAKRQNGPRPRGKCHER
jgi:hypothetical protein